MCNDFIKYKEENMNEMEARLGLFISTLIVVIPVMFVGWVGIKIFLKLTDKSYEDLPENWINYLVLSGFVIYILLVNILKQ
tara:strand:- start:476 stop:718 length:243 start_codon:yes stop_codon:yes gene_type:complete